MPQSSNRLILIVLIILVVTAATALFFLSMTTSDDDNNQGDGGENFQFTTIDGNSHELREYRGKVVILDFWTTWCGPCQYQMLEFIKIYENYTREELEILSINIEAGETNGDIQEFINEFAKYGYTLNWVFGNDDGSLWQEYMLQGAIPTLYIFDQEGNIYDSHEGLSFYDEIPSGAPEDSKRLAPILNELLKLS